MDDDSEPLDLILLPGKDVSITIRLKIHRIPCLQE